MRLITAFLKLVRWPNLLFICLTQILFYYSVYLSLYPEPDIRFIAWIVVASVFIAAAGNVINDYFDLNIDQINKPEKNVINSVINRRWAIFWHLVLSMLGIIATALAVGLSKWYLIAANVFCVLLLWFYSTSLKRHLIIGNVVISVLTAWTVLIIFFAHVPFNAAFNSNDAMITKFFRISFLYGGFAFIITLIREAIKDVEDRKGDEQYGCNTLPIYAGLRATKIYIAVWVIVLVAALIVLQLYILQFGWKGAVIYSSLFIIAPLFYLLKKLFKARA
jgi:4-hydroxybenzoate polyprenyltransferase